MGVRPALALSLGLLAVCPGVGHGQAPSATTRSSPVSSSQNPTKDELLSLAARYVATFVDRFSTVVAEERYVQDWKTSSGIALLHRELKSDFLLARSSESAAWVAFRDVFAVNGVAVRDREDRLARLFLQSPSDHALDQAAVIAEESARYNISNVRRTINHPLYVFMLMQASNQRRFSFTIDKLDRAVGDSVWAVDFKETERPTLVRGTSDKDLPARGRVWIERATGRIPRTELEFEDKAQNAQITAAFGHDAQFNADVPLEMTEQYSVKGNAGKVLAKATYSAFRRFRVNTFESVK
jgi:hypothetical protein